MFNKPSWNNRREGYLKPPDPEQEEKRLNLLDKMKATLSKKKEEAPPVVEKIPLSEIAQQKHYDLDASIEEEVQKRVPVIPPITRTKINPIIITLPEEHVEEVVKEIEETTEDAPHTKIMVFNPPNPAKTSIDDLLDALKTVENYFAAAKNETVFLGDNIHESDYETSDFLHSIELSNFSSEEKIELIDKLTEIRQRRRTYKIRQEFFKEIELFVDKNENIANKLGMLRSQLVRIKDKHNMAQYFTKVRTDVKQDRKVHVGTRALGQR